MKYLVASNIQFLPAFLDHAMTSLAEQFLVLLEQKI